MRRAANVLCVASIVLFLASTKVTAQVDLPQQPTDEATVNNVNSTTFTGGDFIFDDWTVEAENWDVTNAFTVYIKVIIADMDGNVVAAATSSFQVPPSEDGMIPGTATSTCGCGYPVPTSNYRDYYQVQMQVWYIGNLGPDVIGSGQNFFTTD